MSAAHKLPICLFSHLFQTPQGKSLEQGNNHTSIYTCTGLPNGGVRQYLNTYTYTVIKSANFYHQ